MHMNIPYFSIRLSTVICFFLPFIFFFQTCTDGETYTDAYNKPDALINLKKHDEYKFSQFKTLVKSIDTCSNVNDLLAEAKNQFFSSNNFENIGADLPEQLITPNNYSISGIGTILVHKNDLGKISIALSLVLSIVTLFLWRILTRRKLTRTIITLNIVTVVIFILDNLIVSVTSLYGTWTLLCLLSIQLLTEIQAIKKTRRVNT
jgi:hypothetical protein